MRKSLKALNPKRTPLVAAKSGNSKSSGGCTGSSSDGKCGKSQGS